MTTEGVAEKTQNKEIIFAQVSVPGDGSCLFWAVAIAYLLPVKYSNSKFRDRYETLFGDVTGLRYMQKLFKRYNPLTSKNDQTYWNNIPDDRYLNTLVTDCFRNNVMDKVLETSSYDSITVNDFLHCKMESYITHGTFQRRFREEFHDKMKECNVNIDNLQPPVLNENTVQQIVNELDKITDEYKVKQFIFNKYVQCMRDPSAWGGNHELQAICEMLQNNIRVNEHLIKYDESNESDDYIIQLFNRDESHYSFGLVRAQLQIEALDSIKLPQAEMCLEMLSDKFKVAASISKRPILQNRTDNYFSVNVETDSGPSNSKIPKLNLGFTDEQDNPSIKQGQWESRSSTGLLTSYHGVAYQIQWLMVVALESEKHASVSGFTFRTEVDDKDAGKFDDVVWKYTDDKNEYVYNFLQAKHKLDSDTKVTIRDLLKTKQKNPIFEKTDKRPFAIEKYFISYRDKIQANPKYRKNMKEEKIGNLIIATNIDLDDDLKSVLQKKTENINSILDSVIKASGYNENLHPECWTFGANCAYKENIIETLEGTYDLIKLARKLVDCVVNNEPIYQSKDIFLNSYSEALEMSVTNFKAKSFNQNFLTGLGLSDEATNLRKAFIQEAFVKKQKIVNHDYSIPKPKLLAQTLALLINQSIVQKSAVVRVTRKIKVIREEIDGLSGFVLIEGDGVQFSSKFWTADDRDLPHESIAEFRNELINESQKFHSNINQSDLKEFIANKFKDLKFVITGTNKDTNRRFTTCKELLLDETIFWESVHSFNNFENPVTAESFTLPSHSLDDIQNDIQSFFNKLVFAVNFSKDSLNEVMQSKLDEFSLIDDEYIAHSFRVEIAKALDLTERNFISTAEEVSNFFVKTKQHLDQLILIGPTLEFTSKMETLKIEFNSNIFEFLNYNFPGGKNSKSIFNSTDGVVINLITEQMTLTSIKVYQAIKTVDEYHKRGSYIFMRLRSMLLIIDLVVNVFSKSDCNLMIIVCNKSQHIDSGLFRALQKVLSNNNNKKLILISKKDNVFSKRFRINAEKYLEMQDNNNGINDLSPASQINILKTGIVKFQGKEVNLGLLVNEGTMSIINGEVLFKLLNNTPIEIGKSLERFGLMNDFYIDRTISQTVENKESLKRKTSTLSDIHNIKVPKLLGICDTDEKIVELLNTYREDKLQNVTEKKIGRKRIDKKVIQYAEGKEETTKIIDKVVLITAEPGMGKTAILNNLARMIKTTDPRLWIVMANLVDYSSEFNKNIAYNTTEAIKFLGRAAGFKLSESKAEAIKCKKVKLEPLIEIILQSITVNNGKVHLAKSNCKENIQGMDLLELELFQEAYNQGKIIVLLDGVDEILPHYEEKAIELLKVLKDINVKQIFLTTRPYDIVNKLEKELSISAFKLSPFSRANQYTFLTEFWRHNLELDSLEKYHCNKFIDELLNRFSQSTNDQERQFVCIPLQIKMIAESFKDTFKEFYDSNVTELSDAHKLRMSEKLNLATLYDDFFKTKFVEVYLKEKKPGTYVDRHKPSTIDSIENERKDLIEKHKKLALYSLFENDKLRKLLPENIDSLLKNVKKGKEKTGIIDRIVDNKPIFVHRTFAEYFAALWFTDDKNLKQLSVKKFVNDYIFEAKNKIMNTFFDFMLTKDKDGETKYEIHVAVLNNDKIKVLQLLSKDENVIVSTDNWGRTALHLAAAYGTAEIMNVLTERLGKGVQLKNAIDARDQLFAWTPLNYADRFMKWNIMDLLLLKGADDDEIFDTMVRIVISGDVDRGMETFETLLNPVGGSIDGGSLDTIKPLSHKMRILFRYMLLADKIGPKKNVGLRDSKPSRTLREPRASE